MSKQLYIIIAIIAAATVAMWYSVQKRSPILTPEIIIVGTNAEFPPFSYKEQSDIIGFDIDIVEEIFKRLDKKFIIKDIPFDALIPEIQLGNIQVIAAGMTPTAERAKRVIFTRPHMTGNPLQIITLKDKPAITGVKDLQGKRVVVNEGYVADFYMSNQEGPIITRLASASVSDGILAVQSGAAYAFVGAKNSLQPFFDKVGTHNFQIVSLEETEESSALAISKSYSQLANQIQTILDAMEKDGTLLKIKKKWKIQ